MKTFILIGVTICALIVVVAMVWGGIRTALNDR